MKKLNKNALILIAEDDPDDQFLISRAIKKHRLVKALFFVSNGEELIAFLENRGKYKNKAHYSRPDLILLDLNMPCKDGREVLPEIKSNPALKQIPVVILSTSNSPEDKEFTSELGAESYIVKSGSFDILKNELFNIINHLLKIEKRPA